MKHPTPPKLAVKLLSWFSGSAFMDDLFGDLEEVFLTRAETKGLFRARIWYWQNTLSLIFSYAVRKRKAGASYSSYFTDNSLAMLKNYFIIAYRNLKKQKAFTLINVSALAMGMSITLLALAMFVELNSFDEFHPHAENTYRVITRVNDQGNTKLFASSPPALTYAMDAQISGIQHAVHINDRLGLSIEHEGSQIEAFGYFTEPSFFDVFSFPLASGSPSALNDPNAAIITHELAKKLFGKREALGQVLQTKEMDQVRIAGVLKPFPKHTHLMYDFLVGFSSSPKFNSQTKSSNWTSFRSNYYYFVVKDELKNQAYTQMLKIAKNGEMAFGDDDLSASYEFQKLVDQTPGEMMSDTIGLEFDRPTMILFFGISLLILLPACFNYTNMSIAVALKRSKEVGIRKVLGSYRKQIMGQFLIETIIICLLALGISIYIFSVIREEFLSMLIGASSLSLNLNTGVWIAFVLFAIVTGIITGIGPAMYFAKISPIQALRSNSGEQKVSVSRLRKGLLVFQFSLTLIFMIGIGVLLKQYQESRNYAYAFDTEKTFIIPTQGESIDLIRNAYANQSNITGLSFSSSMPGTPLGRNTYLYFPELQDSLRVREVFIDTNFPEHMSLELVWGRFPSEESHRIEQVIVNQTLMNKMRTMSPESDSTLLKLNNVHTAQIIGVIKDYNHEPLNHRIEPMVFRQNAENLFFAIATMNTAVSSANYEQLEKTWDSLFPNKVFDAMLLETEIDKAYHFFHVGLKIFGFLAILAISISCLGLLGMVIFATENRTKEVAIRKVLGANNQSLFQTLAGMFIRLWGIALLFAVPVSYIFYDKVLIHMYNKFNDGVGFIEIAGSIFVTLALGAIVVYWQVNRITRINPANNLNRE